MTIVFGQSTSSFNAYITGKDSSAQFESNVERLVLYFIYLFVGRFVIGYIGTLCICIAAARTTNALRKAFLDSLLRQEVAHFDMHDGGSTATQVTTSRSFTHVVCLTLLTCCCRWSSDQSRYCRETLHLCHGPLFILLIIHRRTLCSVETCSYYYEYCPRHGFECGCLRVS